MSMQTLRKKNPPYSQVWLLASAISLVVLALTVFTLWNSSQLGLNVLWNLIIPAAPLIFFLAPSAWVNVCPLAILQSLPNRLGLSKSVSLTPIKITSIQHASWLLLYLLVPARIFLFNNNAEVVLGVIAALGLIAIISGFVFAGYGGWCSGLCPIRPVEMIYGQFSKEFYRPEACRPCASCQTRCSRLHGEDHSLKVTNQIPFKNQIFSFPGFVLGYFLSARTDGIPLIYLNCLGLALISWVLIRYSFKSRRGIEFSGVAAFLIYYGFTVNNLVQVWGLPIVMLPLAYGVILLALGYGLKTSLRSDGKVF